MVLSPGISSANVKKEMIKKKFSNMVLFGAGNHCLKASGKNLAVCQPGQHLGFHQPYHDSIEHCSMCYIPARQKKPNLPTSTGCPGLLHLAHLCFGLPY
ncbi:TPA: hypothetical protein GDO54_018486 [Pyxicephalus adspersus]|uniref:Uncharacterized protein n=1 Tax=Pyxicephalus adspersus TaxID=30357 RepID=A0AAV2ZIC7_PYXAD|nr:TPA: hypothetical protein GDO54_018486 [Pyxicephalus adspersus]